MTDRWARAEERYRQREADRRYRRDDRAWGGQNSRDARGKTNNRVVGREQDDWDDYDDDTTIIPRYTDEMDDLPPPHRPPPPRASGTTALACRPQGSQGSQGSRRTRRGTRRAAAVEEPAAQQAVKGRVAQSQRA